MAAPWQTLEAIPGLITLPAIWQRRLGEDFPAFKSLCLQTRTMLAIHFPCARHVGIIRDVVRQPDGSYTGVCRCDIRECQNIPLTVQDLTPLEVNWNKLGRALCKAFDLSSKQHDLGIPNTIQFGSFSADAVPVILSIQTDSHVFRRVVAELVATLNAPFILFSPTSDYFDARSQSLLSRVNAAFFALDAYVILLKHGAFQSTKSPGELFANFRPDPKNTPGEDVARQTLALAKALDGQYHFRKAPLYTVFLLYCAESLPVHEIASRCGCHRCVIFARLKLLHQKLGRHPSQLRQYSAHFETIENSLSDPKAKRIYRSSER
jgi:hypothetical protein